MQSTKRRWLMGLSVLLALGLVAAACGDDDNTSAGGSSEGGSNGGGDATGTINISGSSTVLPITTAVGEAFQEANSGATVNVDGPGTGDGFKLFCDGETDISDASRTINDEEKAACQKKNIEYVELKIGFDGITVMTSANNNDVDCLSFADLYALTGPEAQGFKKWSDASTLAKSLGSNTTFPDADLKLTGPGTESGTYDSYIEIALKAIAEERGKPDDATRTDYDASPDDNTIVSNVEASDSSLGWVGFAYAQNAGGQIKELGVAKEPNGDCVKPDADTIRSGSYPLARSLYIYVNKAKIDSNAAVAPFVDFYLDGLDGFVEGAGYVSLPDDQVKETTDTWNNR